jgi:hypothetical protein
MMFWAFPDEVDNWITGNFLSQGFVLYRDIFSHHFPFAYYWMAFVTWLFGKSMIAARLSIVVFQTLTFGLTLYLTQYDLAVGLAAFIWSIFRLMYFGQMVLYNTFAALSLFFIFAIILALLQKRVEIRPVHVGAIVIFSFIAILSDPLSVYPLLFALLCLFAFSPKTGLWITAIMAGCGMIFIGFLSVNDSLHGFINDAILFNSQIYSKYVNANPIRLSSLLSLSLKGLGITLPVWFNIDPFRHITLNYTDFDQWLYTGFFYRFATILCVAIFLAKKQYRTAIFTYLFIVGTLQIEIYGFRAQPFILSSITIISALITLSWNLKFNKRNAFLVQILVSILIVGVIAWVSLRIYRVTQWQADSSVQKFMAHSQSEVSRIKSLTCKQSQVSLAYYPSDFNIFWLTGMKPVSKYTFMYPWVAEIAVQDVLQELDKPNTLAIVVNLNTKIWDYFDPQVYLQSLNQYLNNHYVQIDSQTFISPELNQRCQETR